MKRLMIVTEGLLTKTKEIDDYNKIWKYGIGAFWLTFIISRKRNHVYPKHWLAFIVGAFVLPICFLPSEENGYIYWNDDFMIRLLPLLGFYI